MTAELALTIATFQDKTDTTPQSWRGTWGQFRKRLTTHVERTEKDGKLWSPTVYKAGATRRNENVLEVTAAVGDFDSGTTYGDLLPQISRFEHLAHSTHSHTPEHPKFRAIIPFAHPVPAAEWPDIKARIDEHVFGMATDAGTKDAARMYYLPSCPAKAERFAVHHPGEALDPYSLPPASATIAQGNGHAGTEKGTGKVPLGKAALDFVANGATINTQRSRAIAAARNYLSAGYSEAETIEAMWRGLQASPQDKNDPWTKDQVFDMVLDLASKPAPPLPPFQPTGNGKGHLDDVQATKEEQLETWPDPEPITTSLEPVPALPPELIPGPLRAWATDVAHRMACPLAFIAVAIMVMAGSLIGAGCGIRPKRRDDWHIVPNLWGGVVGRPGSLKTPALQEVLTALSRLESQAKEDFDEAIRAFEAEKEAFKAQREALKGDMLAVAKGKGDGATMTDVKQRFAALAEPACPTWRRFKTNDSTVEKMAELLRDNPRGVLLFRDELVGLLTSWDREGRESDRAFFLEAWNGYGSLTSDRIGRGTVHVDNLCVSILGGIQPGKLLAYLHQASSEMENDGLIQRMQLLVYPDEPQAWELVDEYPDAAARQRAFNVTKALAGMEFNSPYLHFDDEAQELFYEWLYELEGKLRSDESPVLLEHLSKYRSLMPSLALIDHLIAVADGTASGPVSRGSAERAAAWCEYLESHARRIYGLVGRVAQRAASELAKKITTGALRDNFTLHDVYHKGWFLLGTREAALVACGELEEAGWLQKDERKTAGRPSTVYRVNPKIAVNARDKEPLEPLEPTFSGFGGSLTQAFGENLEV